MELFKKLVECSSPSSNEIEVRNLITKEVKPYVDEIEVDKLGNLICRIKGEGPKVMVAAHMDQIGMMVTKIEKEGFLRFTNVGGISPFNSLHQRVYLSDKVSGVVSKDGKVEMKKLALKDMYIDIGADSKEEAEKLVSIGDIFTYYPNFAEDDKRIVSGSIDNRVGCYMAIESIKRIVSERKNIENDELNDIYIVFTVQEELGLRGATTAAFKIEPDFGLAVDVTGSGDTPGDEAFDVKLGKGTAIKVKDRGIIVDPIVKNYMIDIAKSKKINYQLEILEYGATDSAAIQLSRSGVLSGCISVPTRYIHSPSETIFKSDLEESIKLLTEILLDSDIKKLI